MQDQFVTVETRIAGVTFDNPDGTSRQALARLLVPGDPLLLVREPMNPFDQNAIALQARDGKAGGRKLGFLPRALAAVLAPVVDAGLIVEGRVVRVQKIPRHGLWTPPVWGVRIELNGLLSSLALPVRTGLEPALIRACREDEDEMGDAPALGGLRSRP
ncbi:MAG: HIRAN domain-containing protein [Candidatus Sericytochromatia bacterium]|nr:HIRAN domain-containing protein [Candidatus Sericytochromatia bacterium]